MLRCVLIRHFYPGFGTLCIVRPSRCWAMHLTFSPFLDPAGMGIRLTFKPRAVCSLGESPRVSACSIALALRACALSTLPTLCKLWLRWSATPAPGAMGNPSGDLIPEARFVRICARLCAEDHEGRITKDPYEIQHGSGRRWGYGIRLRRQNLPAGTRGGWRRQPAARAPLNRALGRPSEEKGDSSLRL